MSSFTDYLEAKVLNHVFGGVSYTMPTLYVALFTTATDDAGGGTEVTGGDYVRVAASFSVTGNTASNSGVVTWPVASAGWGTVVDVAIFDDPSAGQMLAHSSLSVSRAVLSGDTFHIPVGNLTINLD